ncbi:MAG TPA: hypothetical protein VGX03_07760, partial [Candidatus Binatia bacterium]|nr:hypothetical protein [Candidatus Binatia bacterium]
LYRRDWQAVQEWAEAEIAFSTEQGFAAFAAIGTMHRGRALAEQGHWEEGIRQMRQGLAAYRATSTELGRSLILYGMAEVYGKAGVIEEGLATLAEAFAVVERTEVRRDEAEPYRIKGELTLQKEFNVQGSTFQVQESPKSEVRSPESEAEEYFQKAIAVAKKQQAKSLELRAVMSLSRLWQQQGKKAEARHMLAEIYYWFTEGFDTKDLQEAKGLLAELA